MTYLGRHFALSQNLGSGVFCNEEGLFVDRVPLLERNSNQDRSGQWQPRPVSALNSELTARYGLPIDFAAKTGGLAAVARALNRGDILHARIATLHLQIPDPLALTKAVLAVHQIVNLARQLRASDLLKADWDPLKHPRWPAGSPDSVGGEFAPRDTIDDSSVEARNTPITPAQMVIPAPELTIPRLFPPGLTIPRGAPSPWPSEIVPGPLVPPNVNPITIPRNPYPRRPKCVKEWEEATRDCLDLWLGGSWEGTIFVEWAHSRRMHHGPCFAGLRRQQSGRLERRRKQ